MTVQPSRIRLRIYRVGVGNCLLLTVTYGSTVPDGRRERHMLIDCGSVETADGAPTLADVVAKVEEHCGGQLDVVVATSRRTDHIGGFGAPATRAVLDRLNPRRVIRPWTDLPAERRADPEVDLAQRHYLDLLDSVHRQAEAASRYAFDSEAEADQGATITASGLRSAAADSLLDEWDRRGRATYATAGMTFELAAEMPRVTVDVLGPAAVDLTPSLTPNGADVAQHWLALAAQDALAGHLEQGPPAALMKARRVLAEPAGVGAAEWLRRTISAERVTQGMEIVETLDDVLANSGLILLIRVGSRSLLLASDVRADGWSPVIERVVGTEKVPRDRRLAALLTRVDLYQVGRHVRRGGGPRRLTGLWDSRGPSTRPLVSVLTGGGNGSALSRFGPVYGFPELAADVWWFDLEAPARGREGYAYAAGPPITDSAPSQDPAR